MFASLVKWISQEGGYVHPELELRGTGDERGIFTKSIIRCGEALIRLPLRLAIYGGADTTVTTTTNDDDDDDEVTTTINTKTLSTAIATAPNLTSASPWLKCLIAFYQARSGKNGPTSSTFYYKPYLDSLPTEYETLFAWTDQEISNYLGGTTLGHLIQMERTQNALQTRYLTSVRPILEEHGLVGNKATSQPSLNEVPSKKELDEFQDACLCISTRAFHLSPGDVDDENVDTAHKGPFLLPLIDLLNHDSGVGKCTTLQSDGKLFSMKAERDIQMEEQVLHSYGNQLCAAQFLQTFGFVPLEAMQRACRPETINSTVSSMSSTITTPPLTPAALAKTSVVEACRKVAASEYPAQLRQHMKHIGMEEEDEVWEILLDEMEHRDTSIVSNDILVNSNPPFVSEELITLCSLLLIPTDAYDTMVSSDLSLLDRSVLDDYYLGMLIGRSILTAIEQKQSTYTPLSKHLDLIQNASSVEADDRVLLSALLDQKQLAHNNTSTGMDECTRRRAMYGLTVRLEEKRCLQALESEIRDILECLERGDSPNATQHTPDAPNDSLDGVGRMRKPDDDLLQSTPIKRPKPE